MRTGRHISLEQNTWLADAALWAAEDSGQPDARRLRLLRNLALAREEALTPRQRQVLALRYDRQLSVRAIARQLRVQPSTVSRTLHRAEARLRSCLRYSF